MRRRFSLFFRVLLCLVVAGVAAGVVAACAGDAAALCDYGECQAPIDATAGVMPDGSALSSGDANAVTVPPGDGELGDGSSSEEGEAGEDASVSCGDDAASVAYCGEDAGCVDTTSSAANCGACGAACTSAPDGGVAVCVDSGCTFACEPGYVLCQGGCHAENGAPTDPCVVTEDVGVFVATSGTDAPGNGTRSAPFATIGYAIANVGALSRVYVCAGTYTAPVVVGSGTPAITVFGGFSCGSPTTWDYDPTHQHVKVQPVAGTIPLSITNVSSALTLANLEFDAANANTPGGSSIAGSIVASPLVTLQSVILSAGTGSNGANGTLSAYTYPAASLLQGGAADGGTSGPGCALPTSGLSCPGGGATSGGAGGLGGLPAGGDGTSGSPTLDGGVGQTAVECAGGNGTMLAGAPAPQGGQGSGASTSGTLSGTNQWLPAGGNAGSPGGPGQGGGGGGGSATGAGGGGGCGGCGGAPGGGGEGGGASIGLLIVGSANTITLNACTIAAAQGGNGGNGVAGQGGDTAIGAGGEPAGLGCQGGRGGAGGNGGGGGGGAGGLSVGVLYQGAEPTLVSTTPTAASSEASGGVGAGTNNGGIAGVIAPTLAL